MASLNHTAGPGNPTSPPKWQEGEKCQRERVASWAQDTDLFCQPCPASWGWSHGSPANGRGRDPGVRGCPAQPPSHPLPPPSPRAPRREPGRGRRQGREERGREGEEGARLGGRWGGGEGEKERKYFPCPRLQSQCAVWEKMCRIFWGGHVGGRARRGPGTVPA